MLSEWWKHLRKRKRAQNKLAVKLKEGMSITYGPVTRSIGGVNYDFDYVVDCNVGTEKSDGRMKQVAVSTPAPPY